MKLKIISDPDITSHTVKIFRMLSNFVKIIPQGPKRGSVTGPLDLHKPMLGFLTSKKN